MKKVLVGCEVERVMDVELQILKHLKRSRSASFADRAFPTVSIIDEYCDSYKNLFSDVRNSEMF
jgi:hypothetical protein